MLNFKEFCNEEVSKEKDEKYYTIYFNDIDKIDNFKNTGVKVQIQ